VNNQEKEDLLSELRKAVNVDFEKWFHSSVPSLGGRTPEEVLNSQNGEQELRRLITALNYGIPM
jgi:uncharacterized protein (DUF2384 family)